MAYHHEDIAYFVRTSPYLALAKPGRAVSFLQRRAEAAEECLPALRAYPALRIEPLDFFYTCLRSLAVLDGAFFEALVRDHTWRGAVWGSWLAMLDPRAEFLEPLRAAGPRCPENAWLVDCAVATIEGRAAGVPGQAVADLGARCRRSLLGVPRPAVRIRRAPTAADLLQMAEERRRIQSAYTEAGTDAARRVLTGTLVHWYAMDHERWSRSEASGIMAARVTHEH